MKRIILIALPALFALGIAACDPPAETNTTQRSSLPGNTEKMNTGKAQTEPAALAKSDESAADATLSEKVRQALITERGINARDLQVAAHNGVVTLSGKVEETSDQERMMLIAMSVDGVRSVVSSLVVERPA